MLAGGFARGDIGDDAGCTMATEEIRSEMQSAKVQRRRLLLSAEV